MTQPRQGQRPRIRQHGRIQGAWPSYAVVVILIAAAIYAFSPRPNPPFAATRIAANGMQVNGLVRSGKQWLAVGEQGRVLVAQKPGGPWHEAKLTPQRGSMLTQVLAIDANTLVAVGHDGWIVRSEDNGGSWKEASFNTEHSDPYLGVAGPYDGRLFAFGAFGLYAVSDDQGQTWKKESLVEAGSDQPAVTAEVAADPYADPFANVSAATGGISDHHFNAMTRAQDGSLILVGERGLIARSTDNGASWTSIRDVYNGSFYGVITLPSKTLLAYGMRGNVFHSDDSGVSWAKSATPQALSVYQATVTAKKEVILVGENGVVMVSKDDGRNFILGSLGGQQRSATVLPLAAGKLLIGGEAGISVRHIYGKPKQVKAVAEGQS